MIALHLYGRLARAGGFLMDLTPYALDWQRSSRVIGGYWSGSFTITDMGWADMMAFFNSYLGCRIVERTFGHVSWEGIVYEMSLLQGGREYRRTLAPEWWHNRVKVLYTSEYGVASDVAWSEDADASDEYGQMDYLITLGGSTVNAATALRDRHLGEFAWPRSRLSGGLEFGGTARQSAPDALEVTVAGFWSTLNWRYYETTASDTASALISTLVAASEFVTAGRVETNSLATRVDVGSNARKVGELIEEIVGQGDASGNLWQGGVYADRQLVYEQAPTTVTRYLVDGQLVELDGSPVIPSLVKPGFLLKSMDAAARLQPGGASVWDDPGVGYVDEVEFARPNGLRLKLSGQEESLALAAERLENIVRPGPPLGGGEEPIPGPPKIPRIGRMGR